MSGLINVPTSKTSTGKTLTMQKITYNNKQYPLRTLDCYQTGAIPKTRRSFGVSVQSLLTAMGEVHNEEAQQLDDEIYFYIADELIELPAKEICSNHLDVPYTFVEEN